MYISTSAYVCIPVVRVSDMFYFTTSGQSLSLTVVRVSFGCMRTRVHTCIFIQGQKVIFIIDIGWSSSTLMYKLHKS